MVGREKTSFHMELRLYPSVRGSTAALGLDISKELGLSGTSRSIIDEALLVAAGKALQYFSLFLVA